jgi:hypothetical protein
MSQPKRIHIPADPKRLELEAIKERQRQRKANGKPSKVTNEILYEMLIDVLENQARHEDWIRELMKRTVSQ